MRYLFIDLEFASSFLGVSKICEFGYVVTDENYNVKDRGNFIINPNIERRQWDWSVVSKILTRKISEYEKQPKFPEFYGRIKKLISSADKVIGHSTVFDVKAINADTYRYELEPLSFAFCDISGIYMKVVKSEHLVALTKMLEAMGIEGEEGAHDAGTDAYNTMLALKQIEKISGKTLEELLSEYPNAVDSTKEFTIASFAGNEKKVINTAGYIRYLKSLKPDGSGTGKFEGKAVCISRNLQIHHINKVLCLASAIINEGGRITLRSSYADIYVSYDIPYGGAVIEREFQLESVKRENAAGANIEIIDYCTLLTRLGLTEADLKKKKIIPYGKRAMHRRPYTYIPKKTEGEQTKTPNEQ